ncbi:ABC transporter permease [Pimelobacter simplex]|uniref:O-antigen export system permease protein n=1 Tax=Nocardioides simplex TaxID=2045 RepID=A0A0A1DTZ2_NOCSI|nr:ABC transporter permease [Pimelobacter simplex]AIY20062.2 O-antigen export system permease protein [Pimelobacter simplex]MCG8153833.1 ABC transporter permease [Pimelobacter simplex]GEB16263.1 transport permease protein [Pimelobacter simplex]SFM34650.1 ABC-2 type transport system permease protein [Pimelobacter simplex]
MTEAAEKVPADEAELPPLRPPSADNGLFAVFHRRYLLKLLVQREISARYQGSFLGLLWSYINPLSQFFIYWFVIGVILGQHRGVPNFPIHLFAALIIVHFFNETFGAGTRSIVRNRALVVKMAMPREMFPVATMLVSLYHVVPQIVILGIAAALSGWTPDAEGLAALVLALAIIGTLGIAGALMFSAANVFFSDFGNAVSIFNNFVRFGVTMMYPYSMVHEKFGSGAQYFLLNPIADAVLLFQRAFWTGTLTPQQQAKDGLMPDNLMLVGVLALLASLVLLAIAQLVFSRLENKIPERL